MWNRQDMKWSSIRKQMLAGWAVACLSSYHQASTISFKTNSSAQCTGQVLKNDMEKSLEELVIKLRFYKLDVGSGTGIKIYLAQSKKSDWNNFFEWFFLLTKQMWSMRHTS